MDKAVGAGVVLGSHSELGAGAALDVVLDAVLVEELNTVLDIDMVLKIAAVEDMGGVLDLGMALDVDMDVVQELGTSAMMVLETGHDAVALDKDVVQELGTAAMMVLETSCDAVARKTLGMAVTLHVALDLGRRHPKKVAGHSSGIFL
ncbi:hypothetical protein I79_014703 [Cricetulus griseus]|uniref:Uncharacterized protein n=1 Tax=Cricetulus griseus TaxID=10029 RepID=G3HUT8_CRIGR|nr:hypothetical protein I79_014703 [Cricetulus griseus]